MNDTISRVKVSAGNWLVAVVVGTKDVRLYANNTSSFSYITSYTSDKDIKQIDLSSDDNYLILGVDSTKFYILVNSNLYEKKMMSNAEAIFFACTFGGVLILMILYHVVGMKKVSGSV